VLPLRVRARVRLGDGASTTREQQDGHEQERIGFAHGFPHESRATIQERMCFIGMDKAGRAVSINRYRY